MQYRNENQIYADLKTIMDGFFASRGFTGWRALQSYQPTQWGRQSQAVTFSTVYVRRVGFQGTRYRTAFDSGGALVSGAIIREDVYREERSVQLDFFKQRDPANDTVNTIQAGDACRMAAAYLASDDGIDALGALGYSLLNIRNLRNERVIGDSEQFQLLPGFDLVLVYDQIITVTDPATAVISGAAYGVPLPAPPPPPPHPRHRQYTARPGHG